MSVYASDIIGTGAEDDPFRPVIADYLTSGWSAVDGRADPTQSAGSMLVFCNPTPGEASVIAADPRIDLVVA